MSTETWTHRMLYRHPHRQCQRETFHQGLRARSVWSWLFERVGRAQTARQVFLYCCLIAGTSNAAPLPGPAPQHRSQSAMAMNRDCETCHQEITRERRASFHARYLLRRSLAVGAQRPSGTTLRLTFAPTKVGHAFPTGDLFRRLMIHVSSVTGVAKSKRFDCAT